LDYIYLESTPNANDFLCVNSGFQSVNISLSKIDDGICDTECCDGSDERNSGVECPNVCNEFGVPSKPSWTLEQMKELIQMKKEMEALAIRMRKALRAKQGSAFAHLNRLLSQINQEYQRLYKLHGKAFSLDEAKKLKQLTLDLEELQLTESASKNSENELKNSIKERKQADFDIKSQNVHLVLLENQIHETRQKIFEYGRELEKVYGPKDVLRPLVNKCFERRYRNENIKICLFDSVHLGQRSLGKVFMQ
jgi:hypothetical protein